VLARTISINRRLKSAELTAEYIGLSISVVFSAGASVCSDTPLAERAL